MWCFCKTLRMSVPLFLLFTMLFLTACSGESGAAASLNTPASSAESAAPDAPLRDSTPEVIVPEAAGLNVLSSDIASIDVSNVSAGYLILHYTGSNEKVKFQISAPDGVTCTYLVTDFDKDIVYPLTGGSGTYVLTLLESVHPAEDLYAIVMTMEAPVSISDEFLPFLSPNVYVNFRANSASVKKGAELAQESYCDLDVINHIYQYVTKTIVYDEEKAQTVSYGYLPSPDETLASGKGICFDYAALMSAMLRSQKIPTRLEVGYAGEIYHAWISCYVEEIGWVDNIIEFHGESWSLLDPTLAAGNEREEVSQYISDGSNYIVKYRY